MARWDYTTEFLGEWVVHHHGGSQHRMTYTMNERLDSGERRQFTIERTPYETTHDVYEQIFDGKRMVSRTLLIDSMKGGLKKVADRVDRYAAGKENLP